jgi:hypothetical protein
MYSTWCNAGIFDMDSSILAKLSALVNGTRAEVRLRSPHSVVGKGRETCPRVICSTNACGVFNKSRTCACSLADGPVAIVPDISVIVISRGF